MYRDGVAMGTRMGPSYANLFVGYVEHQFFNQYNGPKPELYGRYIDDCIGAISSSREELDQFITSVEGTRAFCKNDLIPTQLHTTLHLMAFIFLISYFRLPTFSFIFLEIYMFYISANLCRGEVEWAQRKIYFGTICYLK